MTSASSLLVVFAIVIFLLIIYCSLYCYWRHVFVAFPSLSILFCGNCASNETKDEIDTMLLYEDRSDEFWDLDDAASELAENFLITAV